MNTFSEYHSLNGKKLEIKDLHLNKSPIGFTNQDNEVFDLINFENKNYLISENSCYPCSRVYQNRDGHRFVEVLIVPNGNPIFIKNQNSLVRYSFYTLKLFNKLKTFEDLVWFDRIYADTFSKNLWYTDSERIQFLIRSQATESDIFKALDTLKLFNPFQLTLFSIIDNVKIDKTDLINCTLKNNSIPLSILYLTSPSLKIKISDSTQQIIEMNEFRDFIFSLSDEEIDIFFEIAFLKDSINFKGLYPEFKLDILGIKTLERWMSTNSTRGISTVVKERLEKVNMSEKLIREYYKRLKKNLRNIENKIRAQKGFNIVGSLYNESRLFNLIQHAFKNYEVISQYSPDWLGRQRIDIFIKELNIAIEYNGKQHYEPVPFFGGRNGLLETQRRDRIKRNKCKSNGCTLIEIKYNEDLEKFVENLKMKYITGNHCTTFNNEM
ncbi:hypothetical protein LS482_20045 [Sinomicrobium kalidii]|uniref:hypothetical protein n=1 Tax=Sinomicrobium kalidii TaxID=2900738 RepID=UPI001E3E6619|nr:hypothetical protein [Sinomicrobium kalidii]UGU15957.1 hypothetical protein LS482_20045 [Sinomicrobium kalidii]